MSLENISVDKWHKDEKEWWDKYGNYMTYQWKLTQSLNKILRTELEEDYRNFLFNSDEILLDIGCGSGWLALSFAELSFLSIFYSLKFFSLNKFKTFLIFKF